MITRGAGPVADRFGRRSPLLAAHALFIAMTLTAASTDSLLVFTLSRLFGKPDAHAYMCGQADQQPCVHTEQG